MGAIYKPDLFYIVYSKNSALFFKLYNIYRIYIELKNLYFIIIFNFCKKFRKLENFLRNNIYHTVL